MRVLMFRHAERDRMGGSNAPLSPNGLKQAAKLVEEIQTGNLPAPHRMFCSPKTRTHQTLHQIRLELKIEMHSSEDLDERQPDESKEQFEKRVLKFLNHLNLQSGVVYFATHLDWLEEALFLIHSDTDLAQDRFHHWPPCMGLEFEIQDGVWHFQNSHLIAP